MLSQILLLLFILSLWGIKVKQDGFWEDNLALPQCNAIKGISIALILVGHGVGYFYRSSSFNPLFLPNRLSLLVLHRLIGQLMVVMFLFYSGYGLMESLKKKGDTYLKHFPRMRLLKTWLNFAVAVCVFSVLALLVGDHISLGHFTLALIGWDSVGNSNWYVFVILVCYLLFYLAFHPRAPWKRFDTSLAVLGIFTVVFIICLWFARPDEVWWYNKTMIFPLGVAFSLYREKWQPFINRHYAVFTMTILSLLLLHYVFYLVFRESNPNTAVPYHIRSALFAMSVVLVTRKIRILNPALVWLGEHIFPIYIYQRIPMRILYVALGADTLSAHVLLYYVVCVVVTVAIAWAYRFFEIKLSPR